MKTCSNCGETKERSEFHSRKDSKDGLRGACSDCENSRKSQWVAENKEKELESKRKYDRNNQEKVKRSNQSWRENNRETYNKAQREWRKRNPENVKKNRDRYNRENRERVLRNKREHMRKNRDYYTRQAIEYNKLRLKNDPDFAYARSLRGSFRNILKGINSKKLSHINREDLLDRIEMQFVEGMCWDNYGEWHIDHKKSISKFLKEGERRPHIIYALSNLQPLWEFDNCSKG